jgi:ABC-2 type transport system permease protein
MKFIVSGMSEIVEALGLWRLWIFWGWLDVRQRYRRSLLGPLWVTMTMGISVMATGIVYSYLFRQNIKEYLPYVATGFVLWSLIAGYIGEACQVFIQNEGFIGQLKLPYLVYPLRLLWRYIAFFLHHVLVLLIVLAIFVDVSLPSLLSAVLGLLAIFVNIFWMGLILGLLSVRLRDIPVLISTFIQLLFMITPVIWPAKALGERAFIAEWNPLYHLLESVRGPLLDPAFPVMNSHLYISLVMAIIGTLLSLLVYSQWRQRLLYWL